MRGGIAAMHPERFPYAKFAAALILGFVGGALFNALELPLPWMLGPMTFCTIGAILGAPIAAPTVVRPPMSAVIGVMLGAAFTPAIFGSLLGWFPTIIGLALFVAVSGFACVLYFRKVGRMDMTTAYFSGMPGGLVEMVIVGEQRGGDGRTIALVHSARILLVVMTLPFLIEMVEGVSLGGRASMGPSVTEAPLTAELWIIGCGLGGAVLGHLLRLPAKYLLGPMLVSSFVHATGITDFQPPAEIVQGAQVVLGVTIGCRFLGTAPRVILRILALSFGSTLILLAMTLAFAVGVARVSDYDVLPLMLAYSPGGLAEMSLVAIAVHTEVAFVAAHHIIRILFVMISAGPTFALLYPGRGETGEIPRMRDG
ncbi:MAG: AbrB family transcriptional regulator [Salinarimonas sp.]|nr:AbrB family transcriptional regulator [Salinarimonas sp.]